MLCCAAARLHHGDPAQCLARHVEHHGVPVGGHDPVGPAGQAPAPEVGAGIGWGLFSSPEGVAGINKSLGAESGEERTVGPQVVVLEIKGCEPEIIMSQAVSLTKTVHYSAFGNPVHLPSQRIGIGLQARQYRLPPGHHIMCHRSPDHFVAFLVQIPPGCCQQFPLNLDRRGPPSVSQLEGGRKAYIPTDRLHGPHRIDHGQGGVEHVVLHHGQHQGGGPNLQKSRHLAHVGVPDDHVESPVPQRVSVRLVACVHYGPLQGGLKSHLLLEEVRPLADLERDVEPIPERQFASHLPGPGEDLASHEVGSGMLDDPTERRRSIHQVVLVTAVTVPLAIGVVLVDD